MGGSFVQPWRRPNWKG